MALIALGLFVLAIIGVLWRVKVEDQQWEKERLAEKEEKGKRSLFAEKAEPHLADLLVLGTILILFGGAD